eukprot:Tamp_04367.p1 GENE.Tamp_04367~~Tamp_04367.p1  ORF type:complete len:655 (+),score=74.69 Tamp_04367:992-2956(+)
MPCMLNLFGSDGLRALLKDLAKGEIAGDNEQVGDLYRKVLEFMVTAIPLPWLFADECPATPFQPDTLLNTFAYFAAGLVRINLRQEDFMMAIRTISLLRRLPPTQDANSIHGTNGTMVRALDTLARRMHNHHVHVERQADMFHAFKAKHDAGPSTGPLASSPECELSNTTDPFPECSIPIHDNIDVGILTRGRKRCSEHICVGQFCELRHVCSRGLDKIVYFLCNQAQPPPELLQREESDKQLHSRTIVFEPLPSNADSEYLLDGLTLWASAHSTIGHFIETAVKLPTLREIFPGTVSRIFFMLFYHRRGYSKPLDVHCSLLRLAFEPEQFELPTVYSEHAIKPTSSMQSVCFERLIVANVQLHDSSAEVEHFADREQAAKLRNVAWSMCGVDTRKQSQKSDTIRALFLQRRQPSADTHERKFLNIGEVCTYAHWVFGIKGRIAQSDSWKFCDRVRVAFESDLLVALHSSHMVVELLFAKPGSLIIDVSSFNFRRPGLKSLANLCGISYLEFLTIDKELTVESNSTEQKSSPRDDAFEGANWWSCAYTLTECQEYYKARSVYVPVQHIDSYFALAVKTIRQNQQRIAASPQHAPHEVFEPEECQKPDVEHSRDGLPRLWNWRVCEPQDGSGRCFRSAPCAMAYRPGATLDDGMT